MIDFKRFTLDNGLKVIVHQDHNTPLVAVNIMYNVGSKDENPGRTGFAHLFEHLMFSGSKNVDKFDEHLEKVGGENNAFTNNDITNYYITLPKENIETALWLESDRMSELAFTEQKLEVQKNVVVEEFNQNYLNRPYGDIWLLLRPMAYKVHPYQWPTIGKDPRHIKETQMEEVKDFFYRYYRPNNAILSLAGNIELDSAKELVNKWFSSIPKGKTLKREYPKEPLQKEYRVKEVKRDVPLDNIYRAYHMCSRSEDEFQAYDLISDILSNGDSSRFNQTLIKEKQLFSNIDAYITGEIEEGLFVIEAKLMKGVSIETAEKAIDKEIEKITSSFVTDDELQKVKNKIESSMALSQVNILNRAMNLAYYEIINKAELFNKQVELYRAVSKENIRNTATKLFQKENCSTLYYLSKNLHS